MNILRNLAEGDYLGTMNDEIESLRQSIETMKESERLLEQELDAFAANESKLDSPLINLFCT